MHPLDERFIRAWMQATGETREQTQKLLDDYRKLLHDSVTYALHSKPNQFVVLKP